MNLSKCPVCKRLVKEPSEDYFNVIVEGKTAYGGKENSKNTDPKAIIVGVHEGHEEQFMGMVADGSWKPA
jgi:hypothetical protein